jgi:hypothetical protein
VNADPKRRRRAIAAAAFLAMGAFWAPAFLHWRSPGSGDWAWFHHMWEAGRIAITRFHEAPLWDPFHCGGASLWGNPQAQVFAPTYLVFGIPFGTILGHKLFVLQHALCGWIGMYLVARRLVRLSVAASAFAATTWCASGFFAWHGSGGHATFLAFYYGPLLLLAWRATARDLRYAAVVAALMVLIVTEGAQYAFPFFVVWLGVDLLIRIFDRQSWKRLAAGAALTGGLVAALGAFRVIPVLRAVTDNPRPVVDTDFLKPSEILYMLTRRTWSSWSFPGHVWVWPEYGAFVGWTVLALFLVGLGALGVRLVSRHQGTEPPAAPRRELIALLVGLVFFFLLTEGNASAVHPWPLLQKLPIYRSIHLPSRWRVMLLYHLALLAGMGLDALVALLARLAAKLRPAPARVVRWGLPALVAAVAIADLYAVNWVIVNRWDGPPVGQRAPERRFYLVQGRNYIADFANYPSENVGTERCYDPVPWKVSRFLRLGKVPQATVAPGAGAVLDWGRTSTSVWADVRLSGPAQVTFNQNFAPGWRSEAGAVVDDRGLLALRVPAGFQGRLSARFRPPDMRYSVPISVAGALACLLVWRFGRGRKRNR